MHKYKYLVMAFDTTDAQITMEKTTSRLNELGGEGWDLVSVVPIKDYNGESSLFYFKRPA